MSDGPRETICERSDLPEWMCSHCRGLGWEPIILDDPDPTREDPTRPWSGRAEHTSTCPGCSETISPGHMIVRIGNRFVCAECARDDATLEALS